MQLAAVAFLGVSMDQFFPLSPIRDPSIRIVACQCALIRTLNLKATPQQPPVHHHHPCYEHWNLDRPLDYNACIIAEIIWRSGARVRASSSNIDPCQLRVPPADRASPWPSTRGFLHRSRLLPAAFDTSRTRYTGTGEEGPGQSARMSVLFLNYCTCHVTILLLV